MAKRTAWPRPTVDEPTVEELGREVWDGVSSATDGCQVEPDGTCPHGYPSWMMYLGYIERE